MPLLDFVSYFVPCWAAALKLVSEGRPCWAAVEQPDWSPAAPENPGQELQR